MQDALVAGDPSEVLMAFLLSSLPTWPNKLPVQGLQYFSNNHEAFGFCFTMEEIELDLAHQEILRLAKGNECETAINSTGYTKGNCPMIWDQLMCWNETEPGHVAIQNCPDYIHGSHFKALASKMCMENGTWYIDPGLGKHWSNYSLCFPYNVTTVVEPIVDNFNYTIFKPYIPILRTIYITGYTVSLVALLIAVCIFAGFKKLRCPRNIIHMHLFMSFIMRAAFTLLKNYALVQDIGFAGSLVIKNEKTYWKDENEKVNWECKMIISLWQYFILSNYTWILMEGLYLRNLIFLALFTDTNSISLYIGLGWGLPALFIVPWIISKSLWENTFCWTESEKWIIYMIIITPMVLSNCINFIFFINIVRVLLVKLRSSVCEQTRKYRRWAKSTLVLMPLFGVHYVVFIGMSYSKGENATAELIYLYGDIFFTSFQGFLVALLYCFLNGEVRSELAKKYHHLSYLTPLRCWRSNSGSTHDGLPMNGYHIPKEMKYPTPSTKRQGVLRQMFADVKCPSWQERRRSKSDCNVVGTCTNDFTNTE